MKTTRITHPLREIKLEHRNENPLSEFEDAALKEYVRLHDFAHDLIKRKDAMAGEELKLELWLQECEDGFAAVEQEIIKCGPAAGYTWEELDKLGVSEADVDVGEVMQIVTEYQDKVQPWQDATKAIYERYLQWQKDADEWPEVLTKFRTGSFNEIMLKQDDKTIDATSLGADFRDICAIVYTALSMESPFIKNYVEYIAKQNAFILKANKVFDRANRVSAVADEVMKTQKNSGFGLN